MENLKNRIAEVAEEFAIAEEKYELLSFNYSLFGSSVELFGRCREFSLPFTSFHFWFLFILSSLQVIFCLPPLHTASRLFTPLHASSRLVTLRHASHLFSPLHASSRFTPLHAAGTHGPPAIDISSSANYADVLANASSVVSVRSFFSTQGDR